jgi:hypothetical protein
MGTIVYELCDKTTGMAYVGKTQCYLKNRTAEHIVDVWKVIASGRKKFGPNWYRTGGYNRADVFSKHFGEIFRDCKNSNEVCSKIKNILETSVF